MRDHNDPSLRPQIRFIPILVVERGKIMKDVRVDTYGRVHGDVRSCPFCGLTDLVRTWTEAEHIIVLCLLCRASGPEADEDNEAVKLWNQRSIQ